MTTTTYPPTAISHSEPPTAGPVPHAATWGLLAAFAVHDLEELITMADCSVRRSEELRTRYPWLPERALSLMRQDQEHVTTAIGLMGLVVAAAAADGARTGGRSAFYQTVLAGFGLHAATHVAMSAAQRGYTPGVVTAPLVVAPFSLWAWRTLRRRGILRTTTTADAARTLAMTPALILGVHAAAYGVTRLRRAVLPRPR